LQTFAAISFSDCVYRDVSAIKPDRNKIKRKFVKEIKNMNELNMNQMAMINGGSTATKVAHVIGAIATPLATIVGGPLCGAAAAAIMTAVNVAAEVSDK
jgi:hypothetical protein